MLEKSKSKAFGKECYLLGRGKDGNYYWLESASWDCDWYWGLGYIETYTNPLNPAASRDITSHQHFDAMFMKGPHCAYDNFREFFEETTLTDKEIWLLVELMASLYTARHYSDMLHTGGAHFTENPCKDLIQCTGEYNRINNIVIPALLNKVYELLSPQQQ